MFRFVSIFASLLVLSQLSGCCRCQSSGGVPCSPHVPCCYETTTGSQQRVDLSSLLADELVPTDVLRRLPAPGESYQSLDATTCQSAAATNATIANMIELERHWAQTLASCDTPKVKKNLCLQRDLMAFHVARQRNKMAGDALEAFYQLAELEERDKILDQSLAEVSLSLHRVDSIRQADLPIDVDQSTIENQLLQLQNKKSELLAIRLQLNTKLQHLLDCDFSQDSFYWPQVAWQPSLQATDLENAIAVGLENRCDYRMMQVMLCRLEEDTLPIARGVLSIADASLGSVKPIPGCVHRALCWKCEEQELPIRCRQISTLLRETERLVSSEVRSAVFHLEQVKQQVALAIESVHTKQQALADLKQLRETSDQINAFTISRAKGSLLDAESNLVHLIAELKITEVELRRVQGLLASECGFAANLSCECNKCCVTPCCCSSSFTD